LPRAPGARESRYAHLFCGPIESVEEAPQAEAAPSTCGAPSLAQRVAVLEQLVENLRNELEALKSGG